MKWLVIVAIWGVWGWAMYIAVTSNDSLMGVIVGILATPLAFLTLVASAYRKENP